MKKLPLAAYADDAGNRIEYPGPPEDSVKITFRGSNNVARIDAGANVRNLRIDFNADNGLFTLGASPHRPALTGGVRVGQDARVLIGDNVSSTSGVIISAVEGVTVEIGDDVMFASRNEVRADDGHPIFDVHTGKRVNPARPIRIGAHTWLGSGVMVLAGVSIGEGTVIGAGSIVTRDVPNNVIAVGSPAVVVRRDIAWERPHLGLDRPFYKPDASTVTRSPYWHSTMDDDDAVPRPDPDQSDDQDQRPDPDQSDDQDQRPDPDQSDDPAVPAEPAAPAAPVERPRLRLPGSRRRGR